ncbi:hypothetical protein BJV82DRAFT_132978 [Fennellomyces sp. T-0311]|nr:hypothetical protein BJV82DRAFT_132978 [Fennellomyces sp. T-0311]
MCYSDEEKDLQAELNQFSDSPNTTSATAQSKNELLKKLKAVSKRVAKLLENVERTERAMQIVVEDRWTLGSVEFYEAKHSKARKEQQDASSKLKSLMTSRAIMSDQLRGHEGKIGHKLTANVKKAIQKVGRSMDDQLRIYNEASLVLEEPEITWSQISHPVSTFWSNDEAQAEFDIFQEIMNKRRAEEELHMIEEEEVRLEDYIENKCKALESAIIAE